MSEITERLDAIQAQLDAATPGPWKASDFGYPGQEEPSSIIVHRGAFNWSAINEGTYVAATPAWDSQEGADAQFIAAAPENTRYLLDLARGQAAALEIAGAALKLEQERNRQQRAQLDAVQALAQQWNARGESDMAFSKTIPDENISIELLTDGATMVENARHIRVALEAKP